MLGKYPVCGRSPVSVRAAITASPRQISWLHASPSSRRPATPHALRAVSQDSSSTSDSKWSFRLQGALALEDVQSIVEQRKISKPGGDLDSAGMIFALDALEVLARLTSRADGTAADQASRGMLLREQPNSC